MQPPLWRTRLWLGVLASAGVAATHALTYTIVAPNHAQRVALFSENGHGDLRIGSALAFGLAIAALSGFVLDRGYHHRPIAGRTLYRFAAVRLAAFQTLAFVTLEAAERIAIDRASTILGEPVLWIGIVIQAVAALLGAAVLVLLAQLIDTMIPRRGRPQKQSATRKLSPPRLLDHCPCPSPGTGGATLRAPPAV